VTDDGLVVRMDLPHVVEVCANDVTVPFAAMASIAAPGGPLARLAAARRDKPSVYRIHRRGTTADQDLSYTPPAR
jgi:hypothetical protein